MKEEFWFSHNLTFCKEDATVEDLEGVFILLSGINGELVKRRSRWRAGPAYEQKYVQVCVFQKVPLMRLLREGLQFMWLIIKRQMQILKKHFDKQ